MSDVPNMKDITIIGAGPTGLFAAFYAGMRGASHRLIDNLDQVGGQLSALYPEKYVFDVAGFPKILARDLAHQLAEQALQYHPTITLGEVVHHLDPVDTISGTPEKIPAPCHKITTDKGLHYTRTPTIS